MSGINDNYIPPDFTRKRAGGEPLPPKQKGEAESKSEKVKKAASDNVKAEGSQKTKELSGKKIVAGGERKGGPTYTPTPYQPPPPQSRDFYDYTKEERNGFRKKEALRKEADGELEKLKKQGKPFPSSSSSIETPSREQTKKEGDTKQAPPTSHRTPLPAVPSFRRPGSPSPQPSSKEAASKQALPTSHRTPLPASGFRSPQFGGPSPQSSTKEAASKPPAPQRTAPHAPSKEAASKQGPPPPPPSSTTQPSQFGHPTVPLPPKPPRRGPSRQAPPPPTSQPPPQGPRSAPPPPKTS